MQRNRKRLSLNKETLRSLTDDQLKSAAGGIMKTDPTSPCSFTLQQCDGISAGDCTGQTGTCYCSGVTGCC